jgi:hypothetical protein
MEDKMRRVKVLRALILAMVLFALVIPFSVAAQGVYVRGYVVDECGAGVQGALVEFERVQGGRIYGPSEVKNDRGDWGVQLTGVEGEYIIRVTLPNGNVVEWLEGAGNDQVKIADAVDEIDWYLTPAIQARGVDGPITIVTDIPCTTPPNGPTYIWGTTYGATGPNPGDVAFCGDAEVTLWYWNVWHDWMPWVPGQPAKPPVIKSGWVQKAGPKFSQTGTGLYGFGIAPIPGLWKVVATKGAMTGETMFYIPENAAGMTAMGPIEVVLQ